jgi:hypothetical protein
MALVMAAQPLTCLICAVSLYVAGMMDVALTQAVHLVVRRDMQQLSRKLLPLLGYWVTALQPQLMHQQQTHQQLDLQESAKLLKV